LYLLFSFFCYPVFYYELNMFVCKFVLTVTRHEIPEFAESSWKWSKKYR